jgi:hypothetical protein
MTISPQQQVFVDEFFSTIEPLHGENQNTSFNYLAVRRGEGFCLIQGALTFNTGPFNPKPHFQSETVRAGIYPLAELNLDARGLVGALLSGDVPTPGDKLIFLPNDSGHYSAQYEPFHPVGIQHQARYDVLTILGGSQSSIIRQPHLDWELRAASTPYEGLQEVAFEYRLGGLRGIVSVEVIAFNVAAVDYTSPVTGSKAEIRVMLAHGWTTDDVSLGCRVISQGRVETRFLLKGTAMFWEQKSEHQYGTAEIVVPPAAVVHCFVSYRGIAQHYGWLSDPSTAQNPKRAVYNKFDSKLEVLTDFLSKSGAKSRDARDLEAGVAWLLWMLGFSVAHLGGTDRTQDAADLVATTPQGHFAVVECTTGQLKADKLSLLVERADRVKQGVIESNYKHLRVLAAIVTCKTRMEISADIEQAEKLGVLVMTREDLEQALNRTLPLPNADRLYEEALAAVAASKAKHDGPPIHG